MKKSMDFFGNALYAYWKGDRSPFYIILRTGEKDYGDMSRYFRTYVHLSRLEKKLISLSKGEILDVGCATGYYIPALNRNGTVRGIDISRQAIKVAKENGLTNCKTADIFNFRTNKKFDTITLLENNLGMAETPKGAKKLLKK